MYVAFVFSVLLFGGLAYRQINDLLDLRGSGTGEDLDLFWSARGGSLIILGALILAPIAIVCYGYGAPSVFRYALPLVLGAQLGQLALRFRFQRMRIRTRAIVLRHIFRQGYISIPYDQIHHIELKRRYLWTVLSFHFHENEVHTFRIFRASEGALLHRIGTMTGMHNLVRSSS